MVVQLVFLQLILLLFPSEGQPLMSKPGCHGRCGNVTIPYPFGIGTNCFIDDWFEIDCRQHRDSSFKPFLKKLKLEVLEIFDREEALKIELQNGGYFYDRIRDNLIRVINPVFSSNCRRSNTSIPVNLTGSPFVYSQTGNSFSAVGCGSRALLAHIEPAVIGCVSSCGGGCCQITIPSNLQIFNVTLEGEGDECKYAFLAEKNLSSPDSSCVAAVQDFEYAPALLEWSIFYSSAVALNLREEASRRTSKFYCRNGTGLQDTIQCYCDSGYNGNAYLPYSCQDINECVMDPDICSNSKYRGGGTCVNNEGYYLCDDGKFQIKIGAVIGLSCGLGLPILIFVAWMLRRAIKKRNKIKYKKVFFKRNGGLLLEQQVSSSQGNVETTKVFTAKELEIATDRFNKDRILGQGGQGTVYKGMLADGRIVAVKKSKVENEGTLIEQFINEVVILSKINHRNIVKLLGCCLETEVPLLVYEFVPNGTLSQYLHGQVTDFLVSWEMRLQIAYEVAGALSYLHSAASIPIYHRDIKSCNILLDDKYKAKVADFGTSRSVSIEQTHLTTLVQGTFGYLDPEYFQSSQFTDKSDVYSFGVVLVELLTGQKAISSQRIQEGRSLATYFIITMEDNNLSDILDAQVANEGGKHEVMAFASLAKRCLDLNGRNRPTMMEVRMELERISILHKASTGCIAGNYEVEYDARRQGLERWDAISISASSAMDTGTASSADSLPLLTDPLW